MILAVDVGGTNTRLALLEVEGGRPRLKALGLFKSREHPALEDVIERFLTAHPATIRSACIGAAAQVKARRAVFTNLPWAIDAQAIESRFFIPHVGIINDLQANAWGIAVLSSNDFVELNVGTAVLGGNGALIAAGTGLGIAGLFWNGLEQIPIASEGGHVDFAPRNPLEIELLQYLHERIGKRVSYERVLSGPGLLNLYGFLRDTGRGQEPDWLALKVQAGGPGEIAAAAEHCALAASALELFVSIYGAAAGNVALCFVATAGLYIGGGIAPKIVSSLRSRTFLESYLDKGRLSPLLGAMPVRVITNDKAALIGAARYAWRNMSDEQQERSHAEP